jgi:hypothetical protein
MSSFDIFTKIGLSICISTRPLVLVLYQQLPKVEVKNTFKIFKYSFVGFRFSSPIDTLGSQRILSLA